MSNVTTHVGSAAIVSDLNKMMGGSIDDLMYEDDNNSVWIDSGFAPLNEAITGSYDRGYKVGRMYEIYGGESCGKTLMATLAMINAQKQGGAAIFVDWERSFDLHMARNMGLNIESPHFVYLQPRSWESGNTMALKAARMIREANAVDGPIVMVCDSIAAAVPNSQLDKEMDELKMNDTLALAKVTSTTLKMVTALIGDWNVAAIYLNQTREKPGVMYGDPTTTPGGKAPAFYASARIALTRKFDADTDLSKSRQLIRATVVKTKHGLPFRKAKWEIMWDMDSGAVVLDQLGSLLDYGLESGKITKSGAWIDIGGKKYQRGKLLEELSQQDGAVEAMKEMVLTND